MVDSIQSLFNLSFKKFVTPKLASFIYIVGIVCVALLSLSALFRNGAAGFLLGPVFFISGVVFLRCSLELTLAVFQIARYTAEIARRGRAPGDEGVEGEDDD